MTTNLIRWYPVDVDDLFDVLLGDNANPDASNILFEKLPLTASKVALGFDANEAKGAFGYPSLIVISDDHAPEIFSWLRAYNPEMSPLSQFSRVALAGDIAILQQEGAVKPSLSKRLAVDWASIVLGETLAQGGNNIDLHALPISRSLGSFSMTVARAALLFPYSNARHLCIDRLRKVERDARFGKRAVAVDELLPIWALCEQDFGSFSSYDAATSILDSAFHYLDCYDSRLQLAKEAMLQTMLSDSVEQRVMGFTRIAAELPRQVPEESSLKAAQAVLLAAAAFLVGRGTSHSFLLQRVAKELPSALVWFGLIAAKAGPRCWDTDWLRVSKGIERLMRAQSAWLEPTTADLSWAEFEWFASVFEGVEVFADLPKMLPRTLSVEIIPGAACQFRLPITEIQEPEYRVASSSELNAKFREAVDGLANMVRRIQNDLSVYSPQAKNETFQYKPTQGQIPGIDKFVKPVSKPRKTRKP